MTTTALVIATRDRAEMLLQTVESALQQTVPFSRIVISENSSSPARRKLTIDTLQPVKERYPDQFFIALPPSDLPSDEHTAYMQEHLLGDEDYTVLFHDDDLMELSYHEELRKILDEDQTVVGASCNARLLRDNTLTDSRTMGSWSGKMEIGSPIELLTHYMDFCPVGPPPLCGYLHRTTLLRQLSFSRANGGKYSDVAALTQLSSRGKIVWLSSAHMQYRIHAGQNSQKVSTRDYRSLVNYLIDNEWLPANSPLFQSYHFKHLRLKLQMMDKRTKKRSITLIRLYLLQVVVFRFIFKLRFYRHLARRLLRR